MRARQAPAARSHSTDARGVHVLRREQPVAGCASGRAWGLSGHPVRDEKARQGRHAGPRPQAGRLRPDRLCRSTGLARLLNTALDVRSARQRRVGCLIRSSGSPSHPRCEGLGRAATSAARRGGRARATRNAAPPASTAGGEHGPPSCEAASRRSSCRCRAPSRIAAPHVEHRRGPRPIARAPRPRSRRSPAAPRAAAAAEKKPRRGAGRRPRRSFARRRPWRATRRQVSASSTTRCRRRLRSAAADAAPSSRRRDQNQPRRKF